MGIGCRGERFGLRMDLCKGNRGTEESIVSLKICIAFLWQRDKRQKNNPAKARGIKGCRQPLARGQKKSGLPLSILVLSSQALAKFSSFFKEIVYASGWLQRARAVF